MYLYELKNNIIDVYDMQVDKNKLAKFKKKYLELIKTIIIHTNDEDVVELLDGANIMFRALDRKRDEKYSYIEVTDNRKLINNYVMGNLDNIYPINVIGNVPTCKAIYCDLDNQDYSLLYRGGSHQLNEYHCSESVLLYAELSSLQHILTTELENINFHSASKNLDLYKLFDYRKIDEYDFDRIKKAIKYGITCDCPSINQKLENSQLILSLGRKSKRVKANSTKF